MWLSFKSGHRHLMWVEFVVDSPLCSERFFSVYSGFPLSSKTNTSKFYSMWNARGRLNEFLRTPKCLWVNKLRNYKRLQQPKTGTNAIFRHFLQDCGEAEWTLHDHYMFKCRLCTVTTWIFINLLLSQSVVCPLVRTCNQCLTCPSSVYWEAMITLDFYWSI